MKKEARVAIVIGNGSYDEQRLDAPTQNSRIVREMLEKNGFYVYYGENLDKRNFIRLLRKFNKKMRPGGIGLFYFSGHMVQTGGKNYLIPVDHGIEDEKMVARQGIMLKSIYKGMQEAHNHHNIIILDGAKEAPFGSLFTMQKESYAPVKSKDDFSIFIATQPDNVNTSDTFTQDFVSIADKKGQELEALRSELLHLRQFHDQPQPYISLALNRPFYINLPDRLPEADELAYAKIKGKPSRKEAEAFIKKYPNSPFVGKVREQLALIEKKEALQHEIERQEQEAAAMKQAEAAKVSLEEAVSEEVSPKNEIGITLTKPGSQVEETPEKPEEGEERHILLE